MTTSNVATVTGPQSSRRRLVASLATGALLAVVSLPSKSSAEPASDANAATFTVQQPAYSYQATYGGPGRRATGAGEHDPGTYAANDECFGAAEDNWTFFKVFDNDSILPRSEIQYDTSKGHSALKEIDGDWGFQYFPHLHYSEDQIFYKIISPENPEEQSEATVNVHLGQGKQGCS
jgi:hypothetical protein